MNNVQEIETKLCWEIASVTRREAAAVDPNGSLADNGIDSMTFLELLIFIRKEWQIDFVTAGITVQTFSSIRVLAENISRKISE